MSLESMVSVADTSKDGRIRVVHLVTTLNTGGLERVVLDLVRHCDRGVIEPLVACLDHAGDLCPAFQDAGVLPESLHLTKLTLAGRVWRLAKLLKRVRPHVLHTHNSGPHLAGAMAARLVGVPVLVHTKHGRNYVDRPKAVFSNRIASRLSSCVVPVSHDAADVARRVERVPDALLTVIHNGIDLSPFEASKSPNLETAPRCRFIHVARLNNVKDQPTLLRAARIASDQDPAFELDIVGDGPAHKVVEDLHGQLKLHGNVRLLGMRSDVPSLLGSADAFVLSSISEGISLTVLEAMAAELPVIATDVGGNREVVIPEVTGLLVPPKDPTALASAMLRVARDAKLRQQWGAAGKLRVVEHFNISRVAHAYQSLYVKLLAKQRTISSSQRLEFATA